VDDGRADDVYGRGVALSSPDYDSTRVLLPLSGRLVDDRLADDACSREAALSSSGSGVGRVI